MRDSAAVGLDTGFSGALQELRDSLCEFQIGSKRLHDGPPLDMREP
jgi:hypothetical protein